MTHQTKLFPGAAAHDSPQNRLWMSQENARDHGPVVLAKLPDATLTSAMAVWDDDGGRASAEAALRPSSAGPTRKT